MSIKCPKCQFENESDSKFCEKCDTRLVSNVNFDPPTKTLQASTRGKFTDVNVGDVIDDKYKLIEEMGSGGMGVVYKAHQQKPVKRDVALKIIKLGMDTEEVIARFETERQALAIMEHPNIAKVYDAGVTEKGRPYFVMELVRGIPISEYCDKYKLTTRERLEVFSQVCQAVQHAHQKGVIHRDIKPSNVLVAVEDGRAAPKVIDFGIAKATSQRLTEKTIFTQQGILIGTPEYMSPEQAEMTELQVDTTTDIYSLGVLLYELLVGALPYERESLRRVGFAEIMRIIREVEPPRLSTRISKLGKAASEIAKKRRTDISSLRRELGGDLEWITMKAMNKDRTRRYPSASEFAADITRFLEREPIVARPPSVSYKLGKFAIRHKIAVSVSLGFFILIIAFGIMMAIQARRIAREATVANQISDFLVGLFEVSDPKKTQGEPITVREVLDRGTEKIELELGEQPGTKARLLNIIGNVYRNLAVYDRAASQLEKALKIRQSLLGDAHPDVGESIHDLAVVYDLQGKMERDEVMSLLQRSLEIREKTLGPNHPDVAESLLSLARSYGGRGERDKQEECIRRAIEIYEKEYGPVHLDVARSLYELAFMLSLQARYDESDPLFQRVLEIREEKLGPDHSDVAHVLGLIASVHKRKGEYAEAEAIEKRVLEINERVFGPDHPNTAECLVGLAWTYGDLNQHDKAEEYFERGIAAYKKSLGPYHLDIAAELNRFAFLYKTLYMYDKAEGYYKRGIAIIEKAKGPDDPDVVNALGSLANLYQMQEKFDQAEPLCQRGLAINEKAFGSDDPEVAMSLGRLATVYWDQKQYAKAEPLLKREIEILEKQPGADGNEYRPTRELGYALGDNSSFYYEQGQYTQADQMLRRGLSLLEKALGKDRMILVDYVCRNCASRHEYEGRYEVAERIHKLGLTFFEESGGPSDKRLGLNLYYFGEFLSSQKKWDEAEPLLQQALNILEGVDHYEGVVLFGLAYLNREQEKYDKAESLYKQAISILEKHLGSNHFDTTNAKKEYAELLRKTGRTAEAEQLEARVDSIRTEQDKK